MADYLKHHGILKQKWGERHGPPYPLSGGDYSPAEKKAIYTERKKTYSIYNKKHFDQTIKEGTQMHTLSYDKDRTKGTDMFYTAYTKSDRREYDALFNKKIPQDLYDENGNNIGTGEFYKFDVKNTATKDIKVASEDSGTEAFLNLYTKNRDFYNYVTDPERMQALFVDDKYRFKGYKESAAALERIRNTDRPTEADVRSVYRMFNYVIPNTDKDTINQRAKIFNELKKNGYGAMLDTNDSIYGGFHANAPTIVFDMSNIRYDGSPRVSSLQHQKSKLVFVGRKTLGL